MAGARVEVDGLVSIVLGSLVFVGDRQKDRGAERPNSVLEWMMALSFSLRGVAMACWPGHRRFS